MFVQSSTEPDHSARSQKGCSTVLLLRSLWLLCLAGLDGKLQKASKLKGIKNFKASEMGLLPVSVDTWGGFAFVQTGKDRSGQCNSCLHYLDVDPDLAVQQKSKCLKQKRKVFAIRLIPR